MQTKTVEEEFKGNNVIKIIKVDEEGEQVGNYPVISFGLAKAKAIVDHIEDIKQFINNNE